MSRWGHPCIAITARGVPCFRPHVVEYPVTFTWDPVAGAGTGAPPIPLCRMHAYLWDLEPADRVEIMAGWMGRAWNPKGQCWTVMTTVYETRDGLEAAKRWWALRQAIVAGADLKVVDIASLSSERKDPR